MGRLGGPRQGVIVSMSEARRRQFNKEPRVTPTPERSRDALIPGHQHDKIKATYQRNHLLQQAPTVSTGRPKLQLIKGGASEESDRKSALDAFGKSQRSLVPANDFAGQSDLASKNLTTRE